MSEMISALKEQGKAIMVLMGISIITVLAMIVLGFFNDTIKAMSGLGNGSGSINVTAQTAVTAFIVSFGIVGSFASITVLILVVKAIIGVVRGLKT